MMEYLKGKKSISSFLKHKFQNDKSIREDYYDTIKVTKDWLDWRIDDIESNCLPDNPLFNDAINYAKTASESRVVIEISNRYQLYLPYHSFLYFLCRVVKPEIVIETGVERGSSTYMILKAMEKNGKGSLHSVELCKEISLPKDVKVPLALMLEGEDKLKKGWVLHTGNSLDVLPKLRLEEFGLDKKIDVFVHGSDHSFEVQRSELIWACGFVREGGFVVVDRPDMNNFNALEQVFPPQRFLKHTFTLPEKSVKRPLKFSVVQL